MEQYSHAYLQDAQSEGNPLSIKTYHKGRKCRKCRCKLSIYTQGPYCQLHEDYELRLRLVKGEDKRIDNIASYSQKERYSK